MPPHLTLGHLDRTSWPELRDQVLSFISPQLTGLPRSYPGYPTWPLPRVRERLWGSLERTLRARECHRSLEHEALPKKELSRLLLFSHGVQRSPGRGPVPSAGGLQSLELYLVNLTPNWLPVGRYHYDRERHALSQLAPGASRDEWRPWIPSLDHVEGGAYLWVLVGDGERITGKYGSRGLRFLLLEAGHLMQNLCLMSSRLGWTTVPLGAFYETDIARAFALPSHDEVLYLGICGKPRPTGLAPEPAS